jgi:hypothetical protein
MSVGYRARRWPRHQHHVRQLPADRDGRQRVGLDDGQRIARALDVRLGSSLGWWNKMTRSFSSQLYRAAMLSNTIAAAASGNPRRMARRARNLALGKALAGRRFSRLLWGPPKGR